MVTNYDKISNIMSDWNVGGVMSSNDGCNVMMIDLDFGDEDRCRFWYFLMRMTTIF